MNTYLRNTALRKFLALSLILITQAGCAAFMRGYRDGMRDASRQQQNAQQPQQYYSQSAGNKVKGTAPRTDEGASIEKEVLADLKTEDFAQIESLAQTARQTRKRYPGGEWELRVIGTTLANIYTDDYVTDEMWATHIEKLKRWEAQFPKSSLAKASLADSYMDWGWFARGSGYNNTVLPEDRANLEERMGLAKAKLKELWNLEEKCSNAYRVMLRYAFYNSDDQDFNHVFKTAIEYNPDYPVYYELAMNRRIPRWGGKPGELDQFLMDIPNIVKTNENDYIFFLMLSDLLRNYRNDFYDVVNGLFNMHREEIWLRVKKGYADLTTKFGRYDKAKNEYAKFALLLGQDAEALKLMNEIEKNRELDTAIWSAQEFKVFKDSLTSPPAPQIPQSVIESRSR